LRKAILDNREMLIALKNKFLDEISFTQDKMIELGEKVTKDANQTRKGMLEMEAFVNTMVFNEKAARTAMTNQLAEEIDRSTKDYTRKIDDLANYCGDINTALESLTNDTGNLDTEHTNFYYEFQNYKDQNENQIRDIVIRMAMEKMVNMLETYDVSVKTFGNKDKTISSRIALLDRIPARNKAGGHSSKTQNQEELNEMMDRKLDKVYERVRNDNWVIWKESIRLAEKEFNEGGIKKTIDLLPKVVYDRDDLKRAINTLMPDDQIMMPKPVILTGPIKEPTKKPKSPPRKVTPKRNPTPNGEATPDKKSSPNRNKTPENDNSFKRGDDPSPRDSSRGREEGKDDR
jgi:hypothetical protein